MCGWSFPSPARSPAWRMTYESTDLYGIGAKHLGCVCDAVVSLAVQNNLGDCGCWFHTRSSLNRGARRLSRGSTRRSNPPAKFERTSGPTVRDRPPSK